MNVYTERRSATSRYTSPLTWMLPTIPPDSRAMPQLVSEASRYRVIAEAYNSEKTYSPLRSMEIRPRRNGRSDRGPPERREAVRLIEKHGDKHGSRLWATARGG